jgi:hypothetical protein
VDFLIYLRDLLNPRHLPFAGLRALNTLNLRCNRIGNITDVAFMNMPSLIEVHLGCNKVGKLE